MPFKIALRQSSTHSFFKQYLRELISCSPASGLSSGVVLCNAFWHKSLITEPHGKYGALSDLLEHYCAGGFVGTLASSSKSFYIPSHWTDYKIFGTTLKPLIPSVTLVQRVALGQFWHAKLAFRIVNDKPVAAVLGSSNMTTRAYSAPRNPFNYESDALIWINDAPLNTHFTQQEMFEDGFEVYGTESGGDSPHFPGFAPPPRASVDDQIRKLFDRVKATIDTSTVV